MEQDGIYFHNVEVLERKGMVPGVLLQRFPEQVRLGLGQGDHERGRFFAQVSTGCELRFVTDAYFFRLSLSSYLQDTHVMIYCGDFLHSVHTIEAGRVTTLHIEVPVSLQNSAPWVKEGHRFDSHVWRVLFHKQSCGIFCELDTFGHKVRPPKKEEQPQKRWLAYGSSITFGGDVHLASNVYVQQAARRLGVDVENKAVAGSCFCDACMIEYLTGKKDWDFCTLELGINMLNRFTVEEFAQRTRKLITGMLASRPGCPVAVITAFPATPCFDPQPDASQRVKFEAFAQVLRQIKAEITDPSLHLIEGDQVLTDVSGLTVDMTHPSDDGHSRMGLNLAALLQRII